MSDNREALERRLESAAYVAAAAGMTEEEILDVIRRGMTEAQGAAAKHSRTQEALERFRSLHRSGPRHAA